MNSVASEELINEFKSELAGVENVRLKGYLHYRLVQMLHAHNIDTAIDESKSIETLDDKIYAIQSIYNYARVHTIEGADNQFFGYIYYPTYLRVQVKIIDEQTLYVGSLRQYKSTPP